MGFTAGQRSIKPTQPIHRVIITRGDEVHSFILRKWMVASTVVLAAGLMFWLCATTAYVIFRDDILTAMVARHTRVQQAYEDRIAAMRLQIDRISSRQLVDQETLSARMGDIARRQGVIEQRSQSLTTMLEKARQSSLAPKNSSDDNLKTGSLGNAPAKSGSITPQDYASALGKIEYGLARLTIAQDRWLADTEAKTSEAEQRLRLVVSELGLDPERYGIKRPQKRAVTAANGTGGPLIPLLANGQPKDPFHWRTENVQTMLAQVAHIQLALKLIPLRRPVDGEIELSSSFGNRSDPFLGVLAFHAGLDFRAEHGEPIRATAAGKVESAGRDGGYGLMVEIDHSNGISTRYAHMSHISVKVGDKVVPGTMIGRVGSTGRSTGPHLHYETRINDEPVNPDRFLKAGAKLKL